MSNGIRLVRDLANGSIHRADCPLALLLVPAAELVPLEGLESTLAGDEWRGRIGLSGRYVRWCSCVTSLVAQALAVRLEQDFGARVQSPEGLDEVRALRRIAERYEGRLAAWQERLCESAGTVSLAHDGEKTH